MAAKGGLGVELDLDRVPMRETGMTPYEMMLSESQERMLMVLRPGREEQARAIFEKWELDFAVIGRLTDSGRMVLRWHGDVVADMPIPPLVTEAPLYERPWTPTAAAAPCSMPPRCRRQATGDGAADPDGLPRPRQQGAGSGSSTIT